MASIQDGHEFIEDLVGKSRVLPQPWVEPEGTTPLRGASFKRVVDGVTYNIYTSSLLVMSDYEALYQTKSGHLWFLIHATNGLYHVPVSIEDAKKWSQLRDVERELNIALGLPTADVPVSINLRLTPGLIHRITGLAMMAGMSRNEWIMRCLEAAANGQGEPDQKPPPST